MGSERPAFYIDFVRHFDPIDPSMRPPRSERTAENPIGWVTETCKIIIIWLWVKTGGPGLTTGE